MLPRDSYGRLALADPTRPSNPIQSSRAGGRCHHGRPTASAASPTARTRARAPGSHIIPNHAPSPSPNLDRTTSHSHHTARLPPRVPEHPTPTSPKRACSALTRTRWQQRVVRRQQDWRRVRTRTARHKPRPLRPRRPPCFPSSAPAPPPPGQKECRRLAPWVAMQAACCARAEV